MIEEAMEWGMRAEKEEKRAEGEDDCGRASSSNERPIRTTCRCGERGALLAEDIGTCLGDVDLSRFICVFISAPLPQSGRLVAHKDGVSKRHRQGEGSEVKESGVSVASRHRSVILQRHRHNAGSAASGADMIWLISSLTRSARRCKAR